MIQGERYETKDLDNVKKREGAVSIIRAYEDIIKIKKKKVMFVSYRHDLIFKRFTEKHNFMLPNVVLPNQL